MSGEPRKVGMGHLHDLMEVIQRNDAMLLVHSEDDDMVQHMYQKLTREERTEWHNMSLVHSAESEDVSFRRVLRVAEWTGAPVYFVHVSAREGINAIGEARNKGMAVYGETLHNYACFNANNYKEENGMKYHTYPSLKSPEDAAMLWKGIAWGGLHTMATDEYCTNWDLKISGKTVRDVTGGHNGAETRVGITYSEGVSKRGMSLQRFVDVTSTNSARIMGLYPRKGALAPGSDADITLIDPSIKKRLTMDDFHISDYSIWENFEIEGWPVMTILRGTVAVEDGQLTAPAGGGQWIPRKVDREVTSRPIG
jgi:dihydropyrimidinase